MSSKDTEPFAIASAADDFDNKSPAPPTAGTASFVGVVYKTNTCDIKEAACSTTTMGDFTF